MTLPNNQIVRLFTIATSKLQETKKRQQQQQQQKQRTKKQQQMINKTLLKTLKIVQHTCSLKPGVKPCAPEGSAVPASIESYLNVLRIR